MTEEQLNARFERARMFFRETKEGESRVEDDFLEDVIADAQDDAARRLDPASSSTSELRLRLVGDRLRDGFYDSEIQAALAGPLGRELAAAGDAQMPQTRLGLIGVSSGSVVLHYRPHVELLGDEGDQVGMEISPADTAVRRVLRLHQMFESVTDPAQIASFASSNAALLRGARGVVEALNEFDLDMSATWLSPTGRRVRSNLTRVGRDHANAIFRKSEQEEPESVWGLVSALDLAGLVILRRPRSSVTVRVPEDRVSEFRLGERAHLRVQNRSKVDRVGLRGKSEYTFLQHLELDDQLKWD